MVTSKSTVRCSWCRCSRLVERRPVGRPARCLHLVWRTASDRGPRSAPRPAENRARRDVQDAVAAVDAGGARRRVVRGPRLRRTRDGAGRAGRWPARPAPRRRSPAGARRPHPRPPAAGRRSPPRCPALGPLAGSRAAADRRRRRRRARPAGADARARRRSPASSPTRPPAPAVEPRPRGTPLVPGSHRQAAHHAPPRCSPSTRPTGSSPGSSPVPSRARWCWSAAATRRSPRCPPEGGRLPGPAPAHRAGRRRCARPAPVPVQTRARRHQPLPGPDAAADGWDPATSPAGSSPRSSR